MVKTFGLGLDNPLGAAEESGAIVEQDGSVTRAKVLRRAGMARGWPDLARLLHGRWEVVP